ncbi:MAG: hypothetical protein AAFZ38_06690 [Myxococcota bacterium]
MATTTLIACGGSSSEADAPAAGPKNPMNSIDFEDRKAWAEERGLEIQEFDLNRDSQPNVFKFVRSDPEAGQVLIRKDIDLNNDGRVDIVQLYDDKGEMTSEQSDLDFDGRMDVVSHFEESTIARKELDLDYDGKPDIVRYYAEGKVERVESDNNDDGRIDTWEYFSNGELDRVGTDNDGDGIVDHWDRRRESGGVAPSEASSDAGTDPGAGSNDDAEAPPSDLPSPSEALEETEKEAPPVDSAADVDAPNAP